MPAPAPASISRRVEQLSSGYQILVGKLKAPRRHGDTSVMAPELPVLPKQLPQILASQEGHENKLTELLDAFDAEIQRIRQGLFSVISIARLAAMAEMMSCFDPKNTTISTVKYHQFTRWRDAQIDLEECITQFTAPQAPAAGSSARRSPSPTRAQLHLFSVPRHERGITSPAPYPQQAVIERSEFINKDFSRRRFITPRIAKSEYVGCAFRKTEFITPITPLNQVNFNNLHSVAIDFYDTTFRNCDFSQAKFSNVIIEQCQFSYVNFAQAVLQRVTLKDTDLRQTDLRQAVFHSVYIGEGTQIDWKRDGRTLLLNSFAYLEVNAKEFSRDDELSNLMYAAAQNGVQIDAWFVLACLQRIGEGSIEGATPEQLLTAKKQAAVQLLRILLERMRDMPTALDSNREMQKLAVILTEAKYQYLREERSWWRASKHGNTKTFSKALKLIKTKIKANGVASRAAAGRFISDDPPPCVNEVLTVQEHNNLRALLVTHRGRGPHLFSAEAKSVAEWDNAYYEKDGFYHFNVNTLYQENFTGIACHVLEDAVARNRSIDAEFIRVHLERIGKITVPGLPAVELLSEKQGLAIELLRVLLQVPGIELDDPLVLTRLQQMLNNSNNRHLNYLRDRVVVEGFFSFESKEPAMRIIQRLIADKIEVNADPDAFTLPELGAGQKY